MCCAPLTTAWMPEPHSRFTVSAGTSIGTPALSADVTRAVVRVDAALLHVAEHDVIDPLGLGAGALERRLRRDGAEIDRRDILERADMLRHRRARAAENENVS